MTQENKKKVKIPSKGGVFVIDGNKVEQTHGPAIERAKAKAAAAKKSAGTKPKKGT